MQGMASRGIRNVKIWVDDRRGAYPKMTPEVYNAVIAEAHARNMLVQAHAIQMADQRQLCAPAPTCSCTPHRTSRLTQS